MSGAASKFKVMMKFWRKGSTSGSTKVYKLGDGRGSGTGATPDSGGALQGMVKKKVSPSSSMVEAGTSERAVDITEEQPGLMFAITARMPSQRGESFQPTVNGEENTGTSATETSEEETLEGEDNADFLGFLAVS